MSATKRRVTTVDEVLLAPGAPYNGNGRSPVPQQQPPVPLQTIGNLSNVSAHNRVCAETVNRMFANSLPYNIKVLRMNPYTPETLAGLTGTWEDIAALCKSFGAGKYRIKVVTDKDEVVSQAGQPALAELEFSQQAAGLTKPLVFGSIEPKNDEDEEDEEVKRIDRETRKAQAEQRRIRAQAEADQEKRSLAKSASGDDLKELLATLAKPAQGASLADILPAMVPVLVELVKVRSAPPPPPQDDAKFERMMQFMAQTSERQMAAMREMMLANQKDGRNSADEKVFNILLAQLNKRTDGPSQFEMYMQAKEAAEKDFERWQERFGPRDDNPIDDFDIDRPVGSLLKLGASALYRLISSGEAAPALIAAVTQMAGKPAQQLSPDETAALIAQAQAQSAAQLTAPRAPALPMASNPPARPANVIPLVQPKIPAPSPVPMTQAKPQPQPEKAPHKSAEASTVAPVGGAGEGQEQILTIEQRIMAEARAEIEESVEEIIVDCTLMREHTWMEDAVKFWPRKLLTMIAATEDQPKRITVIRTWCNLALWEKLDRALQIPDSGNVYRFFLALNRLVELFNEKKTAEAAAIQAFVAQNTPPAATPAPAPEPTPAPVPEVKPEPAPVVEPAKAETIPAPVEAPK